MTELTEKQAELCETNRTDFSDLRALFINCTLKRSPEVSNTQGLIDISMEIMRRQGVAVDVIRPIDHEIATGVWPDMTEHGWDDDDWPAIFEQVMAADILVLVHADLARREVLGVHAGDRAALRQLAPAQRRRPVRLLRARRRLPRHRQRGRRQALRDERPLLAAAPRLRDPAAGRRRLDRRGRPGPSYLDPGSGGPENDFTNRNTTFMTWNLLHLARMLKDAGGIPAHGNQRSAWDAGCRFDFPNPEYR